MAIDQSTGQPLPRHHNFKHGHTTGYRSSPEFAAWCGIRGRCLDPNNKDYHRYGGRGISVCVRWACSFEAFLADMGLRPSPRHSLGRTDNAGHYEPGNCRWETPIEQSNNRRTTVLLTCNGRTQTAAQWARETGISPQVISWRLRRGWSHEKTLVTPVQPKRHTKGIL